MQFSTIAAILTSLIITVNAAPAIQKRADGVYIHPEGQDTLCLAANSAPGNDVPLTLRACTGTSTDPTKPFYALWDIVPGNQVGIKLHGTTYCLDAGLNPTGAMGPAKLYTCFPGVPQQQWYYTDDLHIAVTNLAPCLTYGRNGVYTYQCGSAPIQQYGQKFTYSAGPVTPTIPITGKQVHPNGATGKCLSISGKKLANGQAVNVVDCLAATDVNIKYQQWDLVKGTTAVKATGSNYCLDFGIGGGSNGVAMKIWTCYAGLTQQTLYYTDDNHIAVQGGSQCLDLRAEDGKTAQSWQCTANGQQVWTL